MIRIAYESSNQMDISDEKLWEEPEMIQRAIFLSIRRKHPNITISTVSAITNNPEDLEAILEAISGTQEGTKQPEKKTAE